MRVFKNIYIKFTAFIAPISIFFLESLGPEDNLLWIGELPEEVPSTLQRKSASPN